MNALDLANNALSLLREPPIGGFNPNGSFAQRHCYLGYHPTRREVLCAHPWLFAMEKTTIYGKAEWKNTDNRTFKLPDLCLKILRIQPNGAQDMDWHPTIKGRAFLLPYRYRCATITYTMDEEDLDLWSADALYLFTHLLAARLCIPLVNSTDLRAELMAKYETKLESILNPKSKMKTPYKEIPVYAVATILGRSRELVFTLIRQGRLHKGKKIKLDNHWFATVKQDRAYWKLMKKRGLPENNQQARVPSEFNPADHSPIQNVIPPTQEFSREIKEIGAAIKAAREAKVALLDAQRWTRFAEISCNECKDVVIKKMDECQKSEDKCRNAMNICLEARKACEVDKGAVDQCHNSVVDCAQAVTKCAGLANVCIDCRNTAMKSELACTRCTAILAAACILQLLLAAYYTLCHYNVL